MIHNAVLHITRQIHYVIFMRYTPILREVRHALLYCIKTGFACLIVT